LRNGAHAPPHRSGQARSARQWGVNGPESFGLIGVMHSAMQSRQFT
jgi:hypothetical protein